MKKQRQISALIFTRFDAKQAIELMGELVDIVDQIVVINGNDARETNHIKTFIKKRGRGKVELHNALALGYADPLRAYGLSKCKYDWVLYLDPDERLNEELKRDLGSVVNQADCSAFSIKRYEGDSSRFYGGAPQKSNSKGWSTQQVRLYDKKNIVYRGVVHEQAQVKGMTRRLPGKYYMTHLRRAVKRDYNKIDVFDTLSYENAFKYLVLAISRDMIQSIVTVDSKGLANAVQRRFEHVKEMKRFKNTEEGVEAYNIAKIIKSAGIIRYLHLDNDKVVERLTERYKNSEQGISLLIALLKERYEKGDRKWTSSIL